MRLIMIIMISVSTVYGANERASRKAPAFTEGEEFKRLKEGFDRFYSMDYEAARVRFERMIELQPEHSVGHYYLATYR